VNHTTVSTGLSNIAFVTATYLYKIGFSAVGQIKTKAQNERKVEDHKRLALSNTQPQISKFTMVAKLTVKLNMFVKFNGRLNLNIMKCIFVVIILW